MINRFLTLKTNNTEYPIPNTHSHPKYRPDIDGLRAIAILSVVGFHAFPDFVPGGFVGVDIFFVISGFLISSIIFKELSSGSFSFANFYARRIKRIFPALILVLSACLLFGWFILLIDEFQQLGKHVAAGVAFISNFVLKKESGYFDVSAELKPLLHLWSLGIEEQFYILWPLLLVFSNRFKFNFLKLTILLAAISFLLNVMRVGDSMTSAFYHPKTRFWELLIGATLAHISLYKKELTITPSFNVCNRFFLSLHNLKAITGTILIAAAIILLDKNKLFPGWWALLPTLGAFLLIAAGPNAWINRNILASRVLVFIGLISFPLYLWHWPLLAFSRIIERGNPALEIKLACMAISFILAWMTYQFIEKYFRKKSNHLANYLLFAALIILCIGYLSYFEKIKPYSSKYPFGQIINAAGEWDYPGNNLAKFNFQGKKFWQQGSSKQKVLFFGDSNIEQYYPRFNRLLTDNPADTKSIIFATGGGCSPIPKVSEASHPYCNGLVDAVLELAKNTEIDTVVVGAQWSGYFNEKSTYIYNGDNFNDSIQIGTEGFEKAINEFEKMLKTLTQMGKKVFLVLNIPTGNELDPKSMISRSWLGDFKASNQSLDKEKFLSKNKMVFNRLKDTALNSGVIIINPIDYLCDQYICPSMTIDGEPIYKDTSHLRPSYVKEHVLYLDQVAK